ncbi:CEL_1a_G0014720.mRNA.1.CDS.1 [Saccharomyces cerevisiae]|nr:CEL_1a_G0014720.mRNA.1.CDS.1 [Saccharomyces cerevisiae]CAI7256611.1 CEL_1a_G0014720.mRNA.1.CDS.1 [Saccharomyces cerevisiae]
MENNDDEVLLELTDINWSIEDDADNAPPILDTVKVMQSDREAAVIEPSWSQEYFNLLSLGLSS